MVTWVEEGGGRTKSSGNGYVDCLRGQAEKVERSHRSLPKKAGVYLTCGSREIGVDGRKASDPSTIVHVDPCGIST